jgi:hydrogenase nickel incorporation protein HypB
MCKDCGCGKPEAPGHGHGPGPTVVNRILNLEQKVLAQNDEIAERNRELFERRGICALNIISSPGSGKTTLLERTLERFAGTVHCAVITGDQQTDNDARRLSGKGAPVKQIVTGNACHLDAKRIAEVLPEVIEGTTQLVLIENVGNLICPAAFDLGEAEKVVLLSVTEGEDKPEKYPAIFSKAALVVITKSDLVPHVGWDRERCAASLKRVCPTAPVLELSARTGEGLDAWLQYLRGRLPNPTFSRPP